MAFVSAACRRSIALSGIFPAVFAILAVPGGAQTRTTSSAWNLELALPSASQAALSGGDGLSWDEFRRHGLTLTASGSGELIVTVHVLTVEDGRVLDRWKSSSFQTAAGRMAVSGRYLPAVQGARVGAVRTAGQSLDVRTLVANEGELPAVLTRELGDDRVHVIFAAPGTDRIAASTRPVFAMPEQFGD